MGKYLRALLALGVLPYAAFFLVRRFFETALGEELHRKLLDRSPIDLIQYGISVRGLDTLFAVLVALGTWWMSWTCYKATPSGVEYAKKFGIAASLLILVPILMFWLGTSYLGVRPDLVLVAVMAATSPLFFFVLRKITHFSPHKAWRKDS